MEDSAHQGLEKAAERSLGPDNFSAVLGGCGLGVNRKRNVVSFLEKLSVLRREEAQRASGSSGDISNSVPAPRGREPSDLAQRAIGITETLPVTPLPFAHGREVSAEKPTEQPGESCVLRAPELPERRALPGIVPPHLRARARHRS